MHANSWLCYLCKWWWWWRWGRWLEISRWKRLTSVWRCCWRLQDDGTFKNNDDTVDDDDDDDWISCWRTLTNVWCRCWRSRRPPLLSQLPDWTEASHNVGISILLLIVAIVVLIDVCDGDVDSDDEKPKFFSSFWLFWRLMHLHISPKCDYGIGWRI